jgi:hypothetical protein
MVAVLIGTIVEIAFVAGIVILAYQVFISDKIKNWKNNRSKRIEATNSAEKIAQVKLLSDDRKEIELFIEKNATYLSNNIVKKLVDRLEYLKAEHVIEEDDLKKKSTSNSSCR